MKTAQKISFTHTQTQGELMIQPASLISTHHSWDIDVTNWQQSTHGGKFEWNMQWQAWQGWKQKANPSQWLTNLSSIQLKRALPWKRLKWISWEIQAPTRALQSSRQRIENFTSKPHQSFHLVTYGPHNQPSSQSTHVPQTSSQLTPTDTTTNMPSRTQGFIQKNLMHTLSYPHQHSSIQKILHTIQKQNAQHIHEISTMSTSQKMKYKTQLIMEWMHENMQHVIQNTAVDVINIAQHLQGDCNEWSALYVTLCRAWNIPAQQVFGLVAYHDTLRYHAWSRILIDDQWVEVDPLWKQWSVDAGHIAWVAGDRSVQNQLSALITQVQASVLAYQ